MTSETGIEFDNNYVKKIERGTNFFSKLWIEHKPILKNMIIVLVVGYMMLVAYLNGLNNGRVEVCNEVLGRTLMVDDAKGLMCLTDEQKKYEESFMNQQMTLENDYYPEITLEMNGEN